MKVTIARIRLVLKKGKTLADGTHPIMLYAAFQGKKMIATGYSCPLKWWDKSSECVKKGYPNYLIINAGIKKLKDETIARRDEYERLGLPYTAAMLLQRESLSGASNSISGLVDRYIEEKGLKRSTIVIWKRLSALSDEFYGKNCVIHQIEKTNVKKFSSWLENEKGYGNTYIRTMMDKLTALCTWCVDKGIIKESPMVGFEYRKKLTSDNSLEYVHPSLIPIIKDYFISLVSTDGVFDHSKAEKLMKPMSKLSAMYVWCLGLTLSGLSPIDLCQLKKSDFRMVTEGGVNYWALDVKRQKTGVYARMRLRVDNSWNQLMIQYMLNINGRDQWFLPLLNGMDGKDIEAVQHKVHLWLCQLNKSLKKHWFELNCIIQNRIWEGEKLPYIDEGLSMYSYRHTFAMHYIQNGGTPLGLATALGHGKSMRNLSSYIALLQRDSDIVETIVEI